MSKKFEDTAKELEKSIERLGDKIEELMVHGESEELKNKLEGKNAEEWNDEGISYTKAGNYTESIKCFRKAVRINPNYESGWYNMGLSYINKSDFIKAIKCFDEVLNLNDTNKTALVLKGYSLEQLSEKREAVNCYRKALEMDPDDIGLQKRLDNL